jgi:hypothetical protein
MASPMQVQAANYGGFGSTYSEVINPKDSVLNDETAGSENVKSGLASLSEFKVTIKNIKDDLVSNGMLAMYILQHQLTLLIFHLLDIFDIPS